MLRLEKFDCYPCNITFHPYLAEEQPGMQLMSSDIVMIGMVLAGIALSIAYFYVAVASRMPRANLRQPDKTPRSSTCG